jgi:hypothetical protein
LSKEFSPNYDRHTALTITSVFQTFFLFMAIYCAYRILVGRPEGRQPLGRPRRRWEDNIKMDLKRWDGA